MAPQPTQAGYAVGKRFQRPLSGYLSKTWKKPLDCLDRVLPAGSIDRIRPIHAATLHVGKGALS